MIFKMVINTIESHRKIIISQNDRQFIQSAVNILVDVLGSKSRMDNTPTPLHSINVALKCISYYKLYDKEMIVAALLHDIVEDSYISVEKVEKDFGAEVAYLVDGLTKFSFEEENITKAEREAASLLKLILYAQKDIRILLIKFVDRIDNLQSIYAAQDMQIYIKSKEAEKIYVPLADFLSVWIIKQKLEDLSFKLINPRMGNELYSEFYKYKQKIFKGKIPEKYIKENVLKKILSELKKKKIKVIETKYREKSLYSIYKKLSDKNIVKLNDIHDLFGFKIILDKTEECYEAQEIIKKMFPKYRRIKDYIKKPKDNGYKSIHIVIQDPKLKFLIEVQIITDEMEATNEYGAASHSLYKGWNFEENQLENINKIFALLESSFRRKQFSNTSFDLSLFTPKNEQITLPAGSTLLDFAYKIHTDLGNHCKEGEVIREKNGETKKIIIPFNGLLENNDKIKVITDPDLHPAINWLLFVRTSSAYKRVKTWLKQNYKTEEIITILTKAINTNELKENSPIYSVISNVYGNIYPNGLKKLKKNPVIAPLSLDSVYTIVNDVTEENLIDYEIAVCCSPLFGEEIVGVKENDRIIVHRKECNEIINKKVIPLSWKPNIGAKKWETRIYFSLIKPIGKTKAENKIRKLINPVLNKNKHYYTDLSLEFRYKENTNNKRERKKVTSGYIILFINNTMLIDNIRNIMLKDGSFNEILPNC